MGSGTLTALLLGAILLAPAASLAQADAGACGDESRACEVGEGGTRPRGPAGGESALPGAGRLLFFWGRGCPHCEDARPFVDRVERDHPALRVERIEVRRNPA